MKVSPGTGDLVGWTYVLEGSPDRTSMFDWTNYRTFETSSGPVRLSERKESAGRNVAILTDRVSLPDDIDDELFSDPTLAMQ